MATYSVRPNGNGWVVKKGNGSTVSNHRKKSGAKRSAKQPANSGDTIRMHRANGTFQTSTTVM